MKFSCFLYYLICIFIFTTCLDDTKNKSVIDHAKVFLKSNPDSAYFLLNNIINPTNLNDKLFAEWCMLLANASNDLHKDMPYISFLIRAQMWYEKHGTANERAQIGLYLGHSYVEEKKYDEAMDVYMKALEIAKSNKNYNLSGYICSYIADLYSFKDIPESSRSKYQEASEYFRKGRNHRSYAFALRDVGYTYCLQDSLCLALASLNQADSIAATLNDSVVISSIANALGNVYNMMDSIDNAEMYLLKSLKFDKEEIAPTYLALSKIYMRNGDLRKAEYYLQRSKVKTSNDYTLVNIIYQHYLMKKELNNPYDALYYLESYCHTSDSISKLQNETRLVEIGKRYDHVKILNANNQLRISRLYSFIMLGIAVFACLLMAFLYQTKVKQDNKKMYNQQKELDDKEKKLLHLITCLAEKEENLKTIESQLNTNNQQVDNQKLFQEQMYQEQKRETEQIRNEVESLKNRMLLSAAIVKKITKLSKVVTPGAIKSPLTTKDWQILMNKIDDIYFLISEKLMQKGIKENSVEMQYCYLSFLSLDKIQEAIILHINPESVSRLRFRVRKKLLISGENTTICGYLKRL